MANGFEVYANDGSLLINNNMIGWFCARSGFGTTQPAQANGVGNTTPSVAIIPVSGYTYPLTAIRIHGDGYTAARFTNAWNSGDHRYASSAPPGNGFTWYVYDYAPRLPATNIGMETYTDSGDRSFSTAYMPFKPVKNVYGDSIYNPGHEMAVCGPSVGGYGRVKDGSMRYYYKDATGRYILTHSDGEDTSGDTHYSYTRDCKLEGALVNGPDYVAGSIVSFDDVTPGPTPLPVDTHNWSVYSPALAVDVTNIPVPGVFF
jgi:hypothetical protein